MSFMNAPIPSAAPEREYYKRDGWTLDRRVGMDQGTLCSLSGTDATRYDAAVSVRSPILAVPELPSGEPRGFKVFDEFTMYLSSGKTNNIVADIGSFIYGFLSTGSLTAEGERMIVPTSHETIGGAAFVSAYALSGVPGVTYYTSSFSDVTNISAVLWRSDTLDRRTLSASAIGTSSSGAVTITLPEAPSDAGSGFFWWIALSGIGNIPRHFGMSSETLEISVIADDGTETFSVYCESDPGERSVVLYNMPTGEDVLSCEYEKYMVIFPDRKYFRYDMEKKSGKRFEEIGEFIGPSLTSACICAGRVCGIDAERIYIGGSGDFAMWDMDTASESDSLNAWVTTTGAASGSFGDLTAVAAYGDSVYAFRADSMMRVYGSENPYRLIDVGDWGCVSGKAVCVLDGIMYFASRSGIYRFYGSSAVRICHELSVDDMSSAVLCGYEGVLYIYVGGFLYTYCPKTGMCSSLTLDGSDNILEIDSSDRGIFALTQRDGGYGILSLNEGSYSAVEFETDLFSFSDLSPRRIKSVSILCDTEGVCEAEIFIRKDSGCGGGEKLLVKRSEIRGRRTLRGIIRNSAGDVHTLAVKLSPKDGKRCMIRAISVRYSVGGDTYV